MADWQRCYWRHGALHLDLEMMAEESTGREYYRQPPARLPFGARSAASSITQIGAPVRFYEAS
jgi:hypothetical protein